MSLLRLLATGKTLISAQDAESRYRLTSQRLLPQFGPARNPFRAPGKEDTSVAATASAAAGSRESLSGARTKVFSCGLFRKAAGWLESCKRKSPVWVVPRFGKPSRPIISHLPKQPVQAELSLDQVRVVRNDLSDWDLQVVTPGTRPTPSSPAAKAVGKAEKIWMRVSSGLLPAGKA